MKNLGEIFNDNDTVKNEKQTTAPVSASTDGNAADDGKRKMYCPCCYQEYYVFGNTCPKCGTLLEQPLSDEEAEEYMEMLFNTRL